MKQAAKRFSSLILSLLFFMMALIVYFNYLQPEYQNLELTKGRELSQAAFIQNENQILAQVQKLVASYKNGTQDEDAINAALPIGPSQASALAQIYGLAGVNGITVQSVNVLKVQAPQTTQSISNSTNPAATGVLVKPFQTISFQITAFGSYEGLKGFVEGFQNNLRLFDVKGVTIHQFSTGSAQGGTQDTFLYNLNVNTYFENM